MLYLLVREPLPSPVNRSPPSPSTFHSLYHPLSALSPVTHSLVTLSLPLPLLPPSPDIHSLSWHSLPLSSLPPFPVAHSPPLLSLTHSPSRHSLLSQLYGLNASMIRISLKRGDRLRPSGLQAMMRQWHINDAVASKLARQIDRLITTKDSSTHARSYPPLYSAARVSFIYLFGVQHRFLD